MHYTKLLIPTLRDAPADAEVISHQLMIRAGLVRQLAAGIYTWLPLGLKVLRQIEAIVREEMDRAGAQELLMSGVLPAELWQESGRWDQYGPELLRLKDRHERDFCLGPTHEEVITDLIRREVSSYRQLPANFYQIQTKFRDEVRPRFGIMRAREFVMKDAYSFHLDQASLDQTYQDMHATYCRIFDRIGLEYRPVIADSGNIGGAVSHEFHVLAESGEDAIAFSSDGSYAANVERAEAIAPAANRQAATSDRNKVATPNMHSIQDIADGLSVASDTIVKTLIVEGEDNALVALCVRGDHELNAVKAAKIDGIHDPLRMADADVIKKNLGTGIGSIGPVGLPIRIVVDRQVAVMSDFVCGANEDGFHFTGVNFERDLPLPEVADLRNVVTGDPSPEGSGTLEIRRGIEVGHIFQLGTKYSEALKANCLDEQGKAVTLIMGCYGIGVSRIVAAAIEQNHDDAGIIWPDSIAPYRVAVAPINMHKSERLRDHATAIYHELCAAGLNPLFYDKKERPGVMFSDLELIGIPHRIVVADRGLDQGVVEYKSRRGDVEREIPLADVVGELKSILGD